MNSRTVYLQKSSKFGYNEYNLTNGKYEKEKIELVSFEPFSNEEEGHCQNHTIPRTIDLTKKNNFWIYVQGQYYNTDNSAHFRDRECKAYQYYSLNPGAPSATPSTGPSASHLPSTLPSITIKPSSLPSQRPSKYPSTLPSETLNPSDVPTAKPFPTFHPSFSPSFQASGAPSISLEPSLNPTENCELPLCTSELDARCCGNFHYYHCMPFNVGDTSILISSQKLKVRSGMKCCQSGESIHKVLLDDDCLPPTEAPSSFPTKLPSQSPSILPSKSVEPSLGPSITPSTSFNPSDIPSHSPTKDTCNLIITELGVPDDIVDAVFVELFSDNCNTEFIDSNFKLVSGTDKSALLAAPGIDLNALKIGSDGFLVLCTDAAKEQFGEKCDHIVDALDRDIKNKATAIVRFDVGDTNEIHDIYGE